MKINVNVRVALFAFGSFHEWATCAPLWFDSFQSGKRPIIEDTLTVDSRGSICTRVCQFGEAAYPITVYGIGEGPGGF